MTENENMDPGVKYTPIIIAIDFDGTLFESDYPQIGEPRMGVIKRAKTHRKLLGDKLILWTCREGRELEEALKACREYGLEFDAVNDNLPELKEKWGNNPRKIYADEYWDDHNVWLSAIDMHFSDELELEMNTCSDSKIV